MDAPSGRVGVVVDVRFGSRLDRPDVLVVRGGLLRNRRVVVPVGEVAEVIPRRKRIVLKARADGRRHERLHNLLLRARRRWAGMLRFGELLDPGETIG